MSILNQFLATGVLAVPKPLTDEDRNVRRHPAFTPLVRTGTLQHPDAGTPTDATAPERVFVWLGPGATFLGVADTLLSLFPADTGGAAPPTVDELAPALVVYNKAYLPAGNWRHHRVGLRLPVPVEIDPVSGDWIVNAARIRELAAQFVHDWRPRLTTPPTPLGVPDPFVLRSDATALIAAFASLDLLAAELWTRALRNPSEVVLLLLAVLRELDQVGLDRAADVALEMLEGATAQQADLLAVTSAGNGVLRRLADVLRNALPIVDLERLLRRAAAKRLLDDALFDDTVVGRVLLGHLELPETPGQQARPGTANPTPGAADDPPGGTHRLVLGRDLAVGQIAARQTAGVTYRGAEFAGRIAIEPYLAADVAAVNPGDAPRTAALLTILGGGRDVAALDAVSARGPGLLLVGLDRWSATAADHLPTLLLAFKNAAADEFDLFFALHGLDVDAPDAAHPLRGRLLRIAIDGTPTPMTPARLEAFLGGRVEPDGSVSFSPEWAARFRLPALVSRTYRRRQVAQAVARLDRVTPTPQVDRIRPAFDIPMIDEELAAAGGGRTFRITTTTRSTVDIETHQGYSERTHHWERWGRALLAHGQIERDPADATRFRVPTPMRICFPGDPARPGVVAGAGALPVAVIVHGNHASFDPIFAAPTTTRIVTLSTGPTPVPVADVATSVTEVPNHEGYERLQDLLATVGIISVSVSTNAANYFGSLLEMRSRTVIAALEHLRTLNADPASRYRGRLDLRRIGLMGHSRGGDVAVAVARRLRGHAAFDVRAVCSLAPTDFTGMATDATRLQLTPADVAFYLVVYGTHDGDVSGLGGADNFTGTGFRLYDRATCPKAMVQLAGCCHNRFNSVWSDGTPADPAHPIRRFQGDDADIVPTDVPLLRTFDEHQKLELEYVGGLFRWKLLDDRTVRDLFDGTRPNRVGVPASLQWSFGSRVVELDDLERTTAPSVPGATRTFTVGGRSAFPDVTVPASTITAGGGAGPVAISRHATHRSQVLRVDAAAVTTSPVAMTLRFPPPVAAGTGPGNWSDFGFLTFRLSYTLDISTAARFLASPTPRTPLRLTDHGGRSRGLPNATAFTTAVPSRPEYHRVRDRSAAGAPISNATLFRFETVRVPLVWFSSGGGVDLARVRELVVEFDQAVRTRVLFDSFQLVSR